MGQILVKFAPFGKVRDNKTEPAKIFWPNLNFLSILLFNNSPQTQLQVWKVESLLRRFVPPPVPLMKVYLAL